MKVAPLFKLAAASALAVFVADAASATDEIVEGSQSPNGRYEFVIRDDLPSGALILRETKSRHVIASTNSRSSHGFDGLQELFSTTPDNVRWDPAGRVVAFNISTERHKTQMFAFRVTGRSVRAIRIAGTEDLFPLGWLNRSDLLCQAGGSDAVLLRFRERPLSAVRVGSTVPAAASGKYENAEQEPPAKVVVTDGMSVVPMALSRSPNGRYEFAVIWDEKNREYQSLFVREWKSGKVIYATPPRRYLGPMQPPGACWSPDSRWVAFTMYLDGDRMVMLGLQITGGSARPVKIDNAEGLSPLGWLNPRELVCRDGPNDAVILRFRARPLSAVQAASTYEANAYLTK